MGTVASRAYSRTPIEENENHPDNIRQRSARTQANQQYLTPNAFITPGYSDPLTAIPPLYYLNQPYLSPFDHLPGFPSAYAATPLPRMERASTVNNSFNIRRGIQVIQHPTQSNLAFVKFQYDAEFPCRISIYHVVIEQPATVDVVHRPLSTRFCSKVLHSGRFYTFPAGVNQTFDQYKEEQFLVSTGQAHGKQPYLDLTQYTLSELTFVPASLQDSAHFSGLSSLPQRFMDLQHMIGANVPPRAAGLSIPHNMTPIIIVIEDLRNAMDPPTGGRPNLLQATYLTLTFPSSPTLVPISTTNAAGAAGEEIVSRELGARVLQQKVQIGSSIYVLKEFFGASEASEAKMSSGDSSKPPVSALKADGSMSEKDTDFIYGTECVVCLTEPRSTVILPCRHLCLCPECAAQLRVMTNRCPICRSNVDSLLQIDAPS